MTSIEFLGHSGLAVRHGTHLLLCDPWMSKKGAYNASWFPYPQYPHDDLSALQTPTAVYLSHEHLDHYDPEFMDAIDRSIPIITGRTFKKRFLSKLRKSGFTNIVELDNFEAYEIAPGLLVRVDTPTFHCPPHWFDSCALIEADGYRIFNLNDCNLALPVADIRAMNIDVMLAQASPAIWYPLVYTTYDGEKKKELRAARRESAIQSFVTAAKAIQPRLAIPFAGPPIFFDPELAEHFVDSDSMFPTAPVAEKRLRHEHTPIGTLTLKPGDVLEIGERGAADEFTVRATPEYADFDYERDRTAYYQKHRAEKERVVASVLAAVAEPAPGLFERFRRHFLPFLKGHPYFVENINIRLRFRVVGPEGGDWVVDFRTEPKPELVYEYDGEHCHYTFEMSSKLIGQVLTDEMSWEDAFLSLRFTAHRDPDRYNQHLFTLFKMSDSRALQAIQKAETADRSNETFRLAAEGCVYEVQRYCPHGGSDLSEAEVEDGHVICPGHHWRFSLADGHCANAEGRIIVRKLSDEEAKESVAAAKV
ncbi:MAG TPA: Rieske 2Fe-2S domain-containing protein [Candidatus Binatia bacterium]|nr:Rieske 2Fe-2S domain-containing protein [Candidatus Binatia bacterium]